MAQHERLRTMHRSPPSTLREHIQGKGGGQEQSTLQKMEKALSNAPDADIPPLKAMYWKGIALGLWTNIAEASSALGVNRSSLIKYLEMKGIESTTSSREQEFFRALERKLRAKTGKKPVKKEKRTEAKEVIGVAPTASPDASGIAQAVLTIVTMIADQVAAKLRTNPQGTEVLPSPPNEEPVVASDWLDEVFSGRMELRGQSLPGVRFVLTAPPFVRLLKGMSDPERIDTQELTKVIRLAVGELRRRLTLSAQTESAQERELDLAALSRELDELMIAITQAGDADICASAKIREEQRNELNQILKLQPQGKGK